MEKLVLYLVDDVKALHAKMDRVEIILERNTASLEEHMRRTTQLEEHFKPVRADHQLYRAGLRIAGWVFGACAALAALARSLGII